MNGQAWHTVVIDGVQYFPLQQYAMIQPLMPKAPRPVDPMSAVGVVHLARTVMSSSNWEVGRLASLWVQLGDHRSDQDLATWLGITAEQVCERRTVWDTFYPTREQYPKLFWGHFRAALFWDDGGECLRWANDMEATVQEMRAWRRAQHGEDLCAEEEVYERCCPCEMADEPCASNCPCVNPYSSAPCKCCCSYGNNEQRKARANSICRKAQEEA